MWQETADLLKKAGSSSKDGGEDSRFRAEAKVTSREALEAFLRSFQSREGRSCRFDFKTLRRSSRLALGTSET